MAKLQKIHAPKGTDEVNVAGVSYRVDNSGDVDVPRDAVSPLLSVGGFTTDDESDDDPTGFVRVKHRGGATSLSWGGVTYERRGDDSFLIPAVAASDLLDHGFVADSRPEPERDPEPIAIAVPKLTIPKK